MIHRDSYIAAYYDRDDKRIRCRLCISRDVVHTVVFGEECHNMVCCSCGYHFSDKFTSRNFSFDNTQHSIVISKTECKMCNYHQGNCLVKRGHECPFNIPEFTKDFANKIDSLRREQ